MISEIHNSPECLELPQNLPRCPFSPAAEFESAATALQPNVFGGFLGNDTQEGTSGSASEIWEGEKYVCFTEMTRAMTVLPNET